MKIIPGPTYYNGHKDYSPQYAAYLLVVKKHYIASGITNADTYREYALKVKNMHDGAKGVHVYRIKVQDVYNRHKWNYLFLVKSKVNGEWLINTVYAGHKANLSQHMVNKAWVYERGSVPGFNRYYKYI